jgi:PPE-repeat protein
MVADRVYGRGFFESSNGRTSLLYFAAAVPMVGFVHGTADLTHAAAAEGYAETRFIKRAQGSEIASYTSGRRPLGSRWSA